MCYWPTRPKITLLCSASLLPMKCYSFLCSAFQFFFCVLLSIHYSFQHFPTKLRLRCVAIFRISYRILNGKCQPSYKKLEKINYCSSVAPGLDNWIYTASTIAAHHTTLHSSADSRVRRSYCFTCYVLAYVKFSLYNNHNMSPWGADDQKIGSQGWQTL